MKTKNEKVQPKPKMKELQICTSIYRHHIVSTNNQRVGHESITDRSTVVKANHTTPHKRPSDICNKNILEECACFPLLLFNKWYLFWCHANIAQTFFVP